MAPLANLRVAEALSGLFGSAEGADCNIQFCLEGAEAAGEGTDLGPPLPAHSLLLRIACERFRAQIDRWTRPQPNPCESANRPRPRALRVRVQPLKRVLWPEHLRKLTARKPLRVQQRKRTAPQTAKDKADCCRPLLRVPLGSEAELPAAHLAIRFAYTGQVHASSIREALEVLRAGDYLAIEGCAAACSQWLADRLAAAGAEAAGAAEPAEPAMLQLYACEDLWPSNGPGFAAVLSAAKAQLVRHFGSTLAALNTPSLTQQLKDLGPKGLEALLESDDLATDSEDSVLTLLATWMRANWARTDAATRQRLCSLVRLTQLSPQAVSCLLLPLAADHEVKGAEQQAGWFTVSVMEAALVSSYHASSDAYKEKMVRSQVSASSPGWHSTGPRKQCVPEGGLSYPWSISREALKAGLEGLQPGEALSIDAAFGGAAVLQARGLAWRLEATGDPKEAVAGVFVGPTIPEAFRWLGSRFAGPVPEFAAPMSALLTVDKWEGRNRVDAVHRTYGTKGAMLMGNSLGWMDMLPLARPPAVLAAADPLAAWAPYLGPDGGITGTLTLLRPTP